VTDARALRASLEAAAGDAAWRAAFVGGLETALFGGDPDTLHKALMPMVVSEGGAAAGDSFVRALLSTLSLQTDVARSLLAALPALGGGPRGESTQRQLLAQLRWLDAVADPAALTDALLDALDGVPPAVGADVLSFLPEVVPDAAADAVAARLAAAAGADADLLLPVLDCAAALDLPPEAAASLASLARGRLASAPRDALPAALAFVLRAAARGDDARAAVGAVRGCLKFACAADPRLPAVGGGGGPSAEAGDRGKGRAADAPGPRAAAAVVRALLQSPPAADAWLAELGAGGGDRGRAPLGPLDAWCALALRGRGSATARKAANAALRRALTAPGGGLSWLAGAVAGRGDALAAAVGWGDAVAAAAALASAPPPGPAAATALYGALFDEAPDDGVRADVLRALLAHVGSRGGGEARAALAALRAADAAALLPHASHVTASLDYVDGLPPSDGAALLDACARVAAAAAAAPARGSRAGDELAIVLTKLACGACPARRALAAAGTAALAARLAGAAAAAAEAGDADAAAHCDREAGALLTAALTAHGPRAAAGGLLLDELAAAAGRARSARGDATPSLCAFTPGLDAMLADTANAIIEACVLDAPAGAAPGGLEAALSLADGDPGVAVAAAPPPAADATARVRHGRLPAALRLRAALSRGAVGLDDVGVVLAAPLALPASSAPPAHRARALLASTNWCRELLAAFAPAAAADADSAAARAHRARHAVVLAALAADAVAAAPPGLDLPTLAGDDAPVAGERGKENAAPGAAVAAAAAAVGARLRPLAPAAYSVLTTLAGADPPEAALAPAAALLAELAAETAATTRRTTASPVPASLRPDPDALLDAAVDAAPATGLLLRAAAAVLVGGGGDGGAPLVLPASAVAEGRPLPDCAAADAALDSRLAAKRVVVAALALGGRLLARGAAATAPDPSSLALSSRLMAAGAQCLGAAVTDASLCPAAVADVAARLAGLDLGAGGADADSDATQPASAPDARAPDLDVELARVTALGALVDAEAVLGDAGGARRALRAAARGVLARAWPPGAKAGKARHVGWKGRAPALRECVAALVRGGGDPAAAASALARGPLAALPPGDASAISAEYPSLTAATLPAWCGAAWDGLLAAWRRSARAAADAGVAAGRASMAPADVEIHVATAVTAAEAGAALVTLARRHEASPALHAGAVRGTARLVTSFLTTLPFWRAHLATAPATGATALDRAARALQKATRGVHALLGEGKARRDPGLAAAAPAARRAMERLVVEVAALCGGAGGPGAVVGTLKHRDLRGRVVSSQPQDSSSEEEEQAEEEEEDGEAAAGAESDGGASPAASDAASADETDGEGE
jgi:Fanconi anemia group D2 protein